MKFFEINLPNVLLRREGRTAKHEGQHKHKAGHRSSLASYQHFGRITGNPEANREVPPKVSVSRNYEPLLVRDADYLANVERASAGTNRTDEP